MQTYPWQHSVMFSASAHWKPPAMQVLSTWQNPPDSAGAGEQVAPSQHWSTLESSAQEAPQATQSWASELEKLEIPRTRRLIILNSMARLWWNLLTAAQYWRLRLVFFYTRKHMNKICFLKVQFPFNLNYWHPFQSANIKYAKICIWWWYTDYDPFETLRICHNYVTTTTHPQQYSWRGTERSKSFLSIPQLI